MVFATREKNLSSGALTYIISTGLNVVQWPFHSNAAHFRNKILSHYLAETYKNWDMLFLNTKNKN